MSHPTYLHPVMQRELDGGHSGAIQVTVAHGDPDPTRLVFLDAEHTGQLVLTAEQAQTLSEALADAAAEVLPPKQWDLQAFRSVYGHEPPAEQAGTLAALRRHSRMLSDQYGAERKAQSNA